MGVTLSCSHLLCGKMARLPLAGRRPGYPVFTSFLFLVVPGNTELFFVFFFSSGKVGSGVQLLKFLFGPCAQAKGLLWNLSGNFILEVSAQDQWMKRYDCVSLPLMLEHM